MARREILIVALCFALEADAVCAKTAAPVATPLQIALHNARQETAIAGILEEMASAAVHGQIVLRNVRVVDAVGATASPPETVVVWNSTIYWIGENGAEPKLEHPVVIDGGGRYLAPGLVDMHVHSDSASDWLLDLANGVTAVREMDGFPWLLRMRDAVSARRVLAPSMYVAGTIINAAPIEGYAVLARNALDGRRFVRQQAACGYDFIKVHNNLPRPIFDAVADEASRLGMDLVGHVPHDIPVRYAVAHGMRTLEHLKGFLDDRTLTIGETDYAAVVDGPDVWNTPTLYTGIGHARGKDTDALLERPQNRYVPERRREKWRRLAATPADDSARAGLAAAGYMRTITARLAAEHARFLAGTDAAGYPFMVMGFALIDELHELERAGLSPVEVLRSATIEPARAMRVADEFGAIRKGLRADLVLLDDDPLKSTKAFDDRRGVMAHGYWLDEAVLDRALEALANVYARSDASIAVDHDAVERTYEGMRARIETGFAFDAMAVGELMSALRAAGFGDTADRFDALAGMPTTAPCAEYLPK